MGLLNIISGILESSPTGQTVSGGIPIVQHTYIIQAAT